MKFEILTCHGVESARWLSLIDKLPTQQQDIHFLPQYGQIYFKTYGFEPFLAFYGDGDSFVIQPFVKRLLNNLPFLKEQKVSHEYYDIANPYGYGGPLCFCKNSDQVKNLMQGFEINFREYCLHEQFASEFTSLHPLLGNHSLLEYSSITRLVKQKQVVYIDLTLSEEEIWQGMNRGHKSGINKAKRSGVSVVKAEPTRENFNTFNRLYYLTMERNQAAERWFFPENYFFNCYESLGPQRTSLFFAFVDDDLASVYLLIHGFNTVYYHFGGSEPRFYNLRTNNLLMYETALWAKRQGYKYYHLGGGVTSSPVDNLFKFKSGFSDKTALLYTYQRIHHQDVYRNLTELKTRHEKITLGREITSDYFPSYRR